MALVEKESGAENEGGGSGDDVDVAEKRVPAGKLFEVVQESEDSAVVKVMIRGKEKELNKNAFFVLSVHNWVRQQALLFVDWKWFDRFILLCIVVNSILLGLYQQRAQPSDDHYWLNEFIDDIADRVLWGIFAAESLFKSIAYGLVWGKKTYLRDPWNCLDFVVVVSGLIEMCGAGGSLSFLRLFRLLRPLRSLNAVPQMKVLVNTTLGALMKLGNVIVLAGFLFMVFGIVGIQLMAGVFYHQCHTAENPVMSVDAGGNPCWSWPFSGDDRLCGGNYNCQETNGFCGGHEADLDKAFRPDFGPDGMRGIAWCLESKPFKLFPETDFVHFDHIGGACLLVFQSMTLEGWTDLMYMVEDAFSPWFANIYFVMIVVLTNFFMLNVALAIVDEVQDEFREEAEQEGEAAEKEEEQEVEAADVKDVELWLDCAPVRFCHALALDECFTNFIMAIIALNVVNMMLARFSLQDPFGNVAMESAVEIIELVLLSIFIVEMFIMLTALGPKGYIKNPITAFDGFVVMISITEVIVNKTSDGGGGGLSALRTFRLFRVMNKLANKWSKLKVLLKAMVHTGLALNYWLILFGLVLYIFTLMWISVFATQFHFESADDLNPLIDEKYKGQKWCPGGEEWQSWHFKQDCIPRAHFDTFIWGFITVFQIMTGENWNTIMYAGMRASQRWENSLIPPEILSAFMFIVIIFFGQTLFLSLFLSMLISKFDEVQDAIDQEEQDKNKKSKATSRASLALAGSLRRTITSMRGSCSDPDLDKKSSRISVMNVKEAPGPESPPHDEPAVLEPAGAPRDDEAHTETPGLPGQLPKPSVEKAEAAAEAPNEAEEKVQRPPEEQDQDLEDHEDKLCEIPTDEGWPQGYAWYILHTSNPVRQAANWLLEKHITWGESKYAVFDNIILLCIVLSTVCMMCDTPLSNPDDAFTILVRVCDKIFAIIFIIEMSVKLTALGLFMHKDSYLRSGWNWLDGIVVMVSIIDFATSGGGPGFLRVLRILRTFRPLRVIARNEGLKVVVQTVFQSMGDLFVLVIVSSLFLLIFALVLLMYLKGALYACDTGDATLGFLGNHFGRLGDDFRTPLCLGSDVTSGSQARGSFNSTSGYWIGGSCPTGMPSQWERASADTPICLARCSPFLESHPSEIEHLCHRKYTKAEELPSLCSASNRVPRYPVDELVGDQYIIDMKRSLTVPCGGYMVENGAVVGKATSVSCRANFCPGASTPSESCRDECSSGTSIFCKKTCDSNKDSLECQACRRECEEACMCEDYCTPLIKDAALCHEQGGDWGQVLSQNFDNIVNAMLTLFEISTTEGWVDVMYAASDSTDLYMQPVRDNNHGVYVVLFPLWILLSFMFLINLAVGIIVDNFMELKDQGKEACLTEAQKKWYLSRKSLHTRVLFYDLTNLHLLGPWRRRLYNVVSSKIFENFIMTSILVNTVVMALCIFPAPTDWWLDFQRICNYVFACIYTIEAILKLIALRQSYWADSWNRFDFTCVVATLIGIVLKYAAQVDLGSATSVIRILRIARLFRLLRFLKELNRLFMCLFISIPKLFNVATVLLLFLILFSILGMSLFGTAKFSASDPTLNTHGNFQTFFRSFVTLFRASTGEAWNEVMHDIAKDEEAFFREDDWCTPQNLFQSTQRDIFMILDEKCLIEKPNACPGGWNPLPAIYWVAYTLLITFMIMNLVVAVILEGYEEGKENEEADNIDWCIETWKKYDPDHRMQIPLCDAVKFINEIILIMKKKGAKEGRHIDTFDLPPLTGNNVKEIAFTMPMKFARVFDLNVTPDNMVTFLSASRQVLRLTVLQNLTDHALREIDLCDNNLTKKERAQLQKLERSCTGHVGVGPEGGGSGPNPQDLAATMAALRLQQRFRNSRNSQVKVSDSADDHLRAAGVAASDDLAPQRAG